MSSDLKSISESLIRLEQAIHAWHVDPDTMEPRPDVTEETIRTAVRNFGMMQVPEATDAQLDLVARRLMATLFAIVDTGVPVRSEDYVPWLDEAKSAITWTRWRAYKKLLAKKKRSSDVLNKLDKLTDEILDLVGNPLQNGIWAARSPSSKYVLGTVCQPDHEGTISHFREEVLKNSIGSLIAPMPIFKE